MSCRLLISNLNAIVRQIKAQISAASSSRVLSKFVSFLACCQSLTVRRTSMTSQDKCASFDFSLFTLNNLRIILLLFKAVQIEIYKNC